MLYATSVPEQDARARLQRAIAGSELPCYVYSYPSKRAYRAVEPARTLAQVWAGARDRLNLYMHIPFCGYRCSFCTLFLTTSHSPQLVEDYVAALQRQMAMYGALLGHLEVVSLYIGGGTPTTLSPDQFSSLFDALHRAFPRFSPTAEVAVEGSPDTMSPERLERLKALGVNRVSMGLQTLDEQERKRAGRPYSTRTLYQAVEAIQRVGFANVNYDLIYGLEGQQRETWLHSLSTTVGFGPRTVTLYPVVFRPLTVIDKRREKHAQGFMDDGSKYALYDESVAWLAGRGFRQNSFVRFSTLEHDGLQQEVADFAGVPLLGLGAGARSYADAVHYGTDFAVRRPETLDIIRGFISHDHRPDEPLGLGFVLDEDEQKRRFCILNLSLGRLEPGAYAQRFAGAGLDDFAEELDALVAEGCVTVSREGAYALTPLGFKFSNVIATLFKSPNVDALERAFLPT
ncbi:STM4012 family radical SAM protein [Pyxidicoccus sp. 3LFB2]